MMPSLSAGGGRPTARRPRGGRWAGIRDTIARVQDPNRTRPVRIDADRQAGTVSLEWADDHTSTYDTVTLRWLCPCAYCRGEAGQPGWLDSNPSLTADQTRLVDMALVGSYAIQPTWGDGHATGFYTFHLLRAQCPCPVCTDERARRHEDHADTGADERSTPHWHGGQR